ncbi:MAG: hypothetical protein PHD61_02915 [Bacteroidales bacterium]|nr:hypothetical protein [Bacteroidales bacterium]
MESTLELNLEEKFVIRLEDTAGMNENGTKRSDIVSGCNENDPVYLRRSYDSPKHRFLIRVFNASGWQIGSIYGEKELAVHLDRGGAVRARITHAYVNSFFFSRFLNFFRKNKSCFIEVIKTSLNPELFKEIIQKDREIARTIARAVAHEKDSMKLTIRNYLQAIDQIVALDNIGLEARAWRQTRIPVNRLSSVYEKEGKASEALKVINWYLSYQDYVGIDPYEMEMILKRKERLAVGSQSG